jgi:acyl-CoA reductase-like NAD-dependent aldehyde dehydrogenase
VASVLAERKQEIARLIAREMGKTIAEADEELDDAIQDHRRAAEGRDAARGQDRRQRPARNPAGPAHTYEANDDVRAGGQRTQKPLVSCPDRSVLEREH